MSNLVVHLVAKEPSSPDSAPTTRLSTPEEIRWEISTASPPATCRLPCPTPRTSGQMVQHVRSALPTARGHFGITITLEAVEWGPGAAREGVSACGGGSEAVAAGGRTPAGLSASGWVQL
ncbi:hypothetical protein ColLi_08070 [Colletotrichum liriopes]|uniref:Uncharacterized protein n=1 Tax=Colletotrichum liriopes TaxID=708192 RepID=A0AA37GRJ8_9PEZI|nr:hypothetical protein ColLi_08070 [Colletotrichum liriopes]